MGTVCGWRERILQRLSDGEPVGDEESSFYMRGGWRWLMAI